MTKSLTELAAAYYADNPAAVDELVAGLKTAGHDETLLDEIIHEGAENSGFDSAEASDINNQGLAYQVASILEGNGVEEGCRLIAEASAEVTPALHK